MQLKEQFAEFIVNQLNKKEKEKLKEAKKDQISSDDDSEDHYKFNKIKRAVTKTRNRLGNQMQTKESKFNKKINFFSQFETFIDVKQFLEEINQVKTTKQIPRRLKFHPISINQNEQANEEEIERSREVLEKSKQVLQMKKSAYRILQSKRRQASLTERFNNEMILQNSSEGPSYQMANQNFYDSIDALIEQNSKEKMIISKSQDNLVNLQNNEFVNSKNIFFQNEIEDIQKKKKDFNVRARKVISLLERATRNIYRNKKDLKSHKKIDFFMKDESLPKIILQRQRKQSIDQQKVHFSKFPSLQVIQKHDKVKNELSPILNENKTLKLSKMDNFIERVNKAQQDLRASIPSYNSELSQVQSSLHLKLEQLMNPDKLESLKYLLRK